MSSLFRGLNQATLHPAWAWRLAYKLISAESAVLPKLFWFFEKIKAVANSRYRLSN